MSRRISNLLACFGVSGVLVGVRLGAQVNAVPDPPVKSIEAWQIAGIRAAFGDSREPFVEPSAAVQREALKLAARRGWGKTLAPEEVAVYLGSEDVEMKLAALSALEQIGDGAAPHAKQIAGLLEDPDRTVRDAALEVLGRLGEKGAAFSDEIVKHREEIDPWIRLSTLLKLGLFGESYPWGAKTLIIDLAEALGPEPPVGGRRTPAVIQGATMLREALSKRDNSFEAKAAASLLRDRDAAVRLAGTMVLGQLGEKSNSAFADEVAILLDDPDPRVCLAAVADLAQMGSPGCAQAKRIAALLGSPDRTLRRAALEALGSMGGEGAAFASEVTARLKNGEDREPAAKALSRMGKEGAAHADALLEVLGTEDNYGMLEVVVALGKMGKEDPSIARKTAALLQDGNPAVRKKATRALVLMGRGVAPCLEQLIALVKGADPNVRRAAVEVLRDLASTDESYDAKLADVLGPAEANVFAFDGSSPPLTLEPGLGLEISFQPLEKLNRRQFNQGIPLNDPVAARRSTPRGGDVTGSAFAFSQAAREGAGAVAADGLSDLLFKRHPVIGAETYAYLDQHGNPGGDLRLQAAFLAVAEAAPAVKRSELRAHLRLWAGGNADTQRSVTWLGKPDMEPLPKEGLAKEELSAVLEVILQLWDPAEGSPALRDEMAKRTSQLADSISGPPDVETKKLLQDMAAKLEKQPGYETVRTTIRKVLDR